MDMPEKEKSGTTLEEALDAVIRLKGVGISVKEVGINNEHDTTRDSKGIQGSQG